MDDVQLIDWVARRVATMAQELRTESAKVRAREDVQWRGRAADQYRAQLTQRAADYARIAADLDRLHGALQSHARHVQDHEAVIGNLLAPLAGPAHFLTGGLL